MTGEIGILSVGAGDMHRSGPADLCVRRPPAKNLTGKTFGRFTVIRHLGFSRTSWATYWECRCACGRHLAVNQKAMCRTQGATQSCGCLASDSASERQWQGHGELSRHYWNHLKHHAAERGVGFQISIEDAWSAFQKQGGKCAISGVPIEMGRYRPPSSTTVRKWPRLGTASLDRKDSDGDYHKDNVQWVHKEINRMKGKLTDAAFIAMCRTVAQFNQGR